MSLSVFIVPLLLLCLLIYAWRKKVNCYASFSKGAKNSLELVFDIFPFLISIFVVIELFKSSGLSLALANFVSPIFSFLGIPKELCELIFLRPFSGSASLALCENIFNEFGPDSYISRCAATIMGSSETVFYVACIYFSKTKAKKLLYAIPVALFCTFIGAILSCFLCKIL